ncbi:hypothetical protein [Geminocystis sp. NIES-3709]|uniref:hypothetical protein n=1 Tax=Geminocystis sp. NIES-3709 TaxID=1617448 RepID=UPI0005FC6CFF|nr:hypothetical protein [Geminocystis sp. NIES-3709]BAQ65145.1 HlpA protein [Geminocystis sp. NIES-3709]
MTQQKLNTSIVFIIFNRPNTTAKVFEAIRKAKPSQLFIIADGARLNVPEDQEKCEVTRKIVENIDWECEVFKNYSDINLGCGKRVSSGISWVFEQIEEAIILEDDCLPHPSFFRFCDNLLSKYRDKEEIMMISGTNNLLEWQQKNQSYHFSHYDSCWGWATWRRAWNFYDYEMKKWGDRKNHQKLKEVLQDEEQFNYRYHICQQAFNKKVDTWDYQWTFTRLLQGGLTVIPAVNLIKNIGLGKDATHTNRLSIFDVNLDFYDLQFPLQHPQPIEADQIYNRKYFQMLIGKPDLDTIIFFANKLIFGGRKIHALLLLQQAIKIYPDNLELIQMNAITLSKLTKGEL